MINNLSERRSKLSSTKLALLEKRLNRASAPPSEQRAIARRPIQDQMPLSFSQERLWFLTQLEPDTPVYNRPLAIRLTKVLKLSVLEQALNHLLQRHEVLRATFTHAEGVPIQRISPISCINLTQVDLSNYPEDERLLEASRLATEEAQQPIDLAQGVLQRATLLRIDKESHILLLVIHHIAFDAWSAKILKRELLEIYDALVTGRPVLLAELPIQYVDYAYWQRQWLKGDILEKQLSYWKERLAEAPPSLKLPTDYPRPVKNSYQAGYETLPLPAALTISLKALSQELEATLYMTLLAAFQTLLHRYTGQDDLVVGSPIAGRTQVETEGLIGLFINTLVLRTNLSGNPTFRNLLKHVQEISLEAYVHQDLPFERLVEEINPVRELNQSPLFQVMFNLENIPDQTIITENLNLDEFDFESGLVEFDLILEILERKQELVCIFTYNRNIFAPETIVRLAGHYQNLLESIVTHPERPISQLPILLEAERHQLLVDWNETAVPYPQTLLPQHFEAQVARTPDAIAAIFDNQHLTYQQLDERASQLARYLQSHDIQPGHIVGLYLNRSLDMLVGLLGVLKAGGTYLPLDPAFPSERLAFMAQDAQVSLILTQQELLDEIFQHDAALICLDTDWEAIASSNQQQPITSRPTPEDLAYIIYTSGSTGKPKGVQLPHQAAVNFLTTMAQEPGLQPDDILLAVTTLSFDIALLELFLPLSVGACVVIADRNTVADGYQLSQLLTQHNITVMQATPATWRLLLDAGWQGSDQLKILCGGEAFPQDLASQLLGKCQSLWNMYGPTETTVWSTIHQVTEVNGSIPIGRPIANTEVYILDNHLQPVPVGVPGLLYIGGQGLAKGYLNRPELTAEKFIPHPFSTQPGARLYCTGDLARYLPDGRLECLGRIDHQVKVRGYRIELGEIEAVLNQLPDVEQALVIVREDTPGDKRLVAYLIATQTELPIAELRQTLKQTLPDYMVPSAFVTLDTFPLTPNGKIDRHALPDPELSREDQAASYVAPETLVEETLADIWRHILGIEPISIHDNFFDLGGHSLLAVKVISRIQQAFEITIPLNSLFKAPNILDLALLIEDLNKDKLKQKRQKQSIDKRSSDGPAELSFAQQRLWFLYQLEPDSPFYNIPMSVRLQGTLNIEALQHSLNALIERHESLRTTFSQSDNHPVQVIAPPFTLSLPLIDLQHLPEDEKVAQLQQLLTEEAQYTFNISQGPLIRAALIQTDADDHVLLLNMHHLISDQWSADIFWRELALLYNAFSADKPSPLAELPIQYADFAHWHRQWFQGEVEERQLTYWKQQLGGELAQLQLPTDYPRPATQTYHGASETFTIPKTLFQDLSTLLVRERGDTVFMLLLAAFNTLLYRYTGQTDLLIGSPIANRNHPEIESLIGFFVNTLVLRTDLSDNPTFQEVLRRVNALALNAYSHPDIPFEKLVEILQPNRDPSYNPIFQVLFNFHNATTQTQSLSGLDVTPLTIEHQTSKFDLTLTITQNHHTLHGSIEYNTDLFNTDTIQCLIGHFHTLLQSIATQPELPISHLPLLSETEQHQLLVDWNQTAAAYPSDLCIHQLFEAQVERTPEAVAVVYKGQELTYRGLNERANQVAHYLQKQGVGPETLVSICIERSMDMAIGLLGILKAGGAYLPLDPAYPSERLDFMLQDAQTPIILTQSHLSDRFPKYQTILICLDTDWPVIAGESTNNPYSQVNPANPVYTIYTSGSTGTPKGMVTPHQALVNHNLSIIKHYQLSRHDRVLQFASISFDVAAEELFPSWVSGATVVFLPNQAIVPPDELLEFITEEKVTVINLPSSYWHEWMAKLTTSKTQLPSTLRLVVVGSEKVSADWLSVWQNHIGDQVHWHNAYGPTETTITTLLYTPTQSKTAKIRETVPIGRPIENVQLYILDANYQPVPIGVSGELYIGGDSVGRGYLHQPALTAEKFIPNPFSNQPGTRLYRTGDLVRYLTDGNIEFLGRIDHQVKVRGYRIELGEVEAVLNQQPTIEQALVIVREDSPGDKRLVAYLIATQPELPIAELRQTLKQTLPDYMVPAAFVLLDTFPLTPNGKIDQHALPAPELSRENLATSYVAPETLVEEALADIWSHILGIEPIGIHDNFFDLGGHSLLATQIITRISALFDTELSLQVLFAKPTIAELSPHIEVATKDKLAAIANTNGHDQQSVFENWLTDKLTSKSTLATLPQRPPQTPIPLSPIQQGLWFLHQLNPDSPFHNLPIALRLKGSLNITALEQSLNAIVQRHEVLRTTFTKEDEGPVQVISPSFTLNLPVVDLSHLPKTEQDDKVQQLANQEAKYAFNLGRGPLIQAKLLRLGNQEHILLLVIHHIISDGWSLEILSYELKTLYENHPQDTSVTLPHLPIQYADYAYWQDQQQAEITRYHLNYWHTKLNSASTFLQLPTDRPRPKVQTFHGATTYHPLPEPLVTQLQSFSRQQGCTLFITLLAAFNVLLYRYTEQTDILIGLPVANRTRPELETLIGYFVNTLILRTDMTGLPDFVTVLNQVRENFLEAQSHQGVPFDKLVEAINPERDPSYNPLFQVMFNDEKTSTLKHSLSGLTMDTLEIDRGTTQFDLTLCVQEEGSALRIKTEYSTDLFNADTIHRLLGHFQTLLQAIATQPELPISHLPLLSETEQHQLLVDWNQTAAAYPDALLPQHFEAQVAHTPDAIAVVFDDTHLTYLQLNHQANQLAHHLQHLGVSPETLVALYTERSLEMVIAILAIFKAGGAYLPLDPDYPQDRLAYMLADSQAPLLLTHSALSPHLPPNHPSLLFLDTLADTLHTYPTTPPDITLSPDNLAYVIYTSGSTGKPKGVLVSHRGILNLAQAQQQAFHIHPHSHVLQFAAFGFDASVSEIFVTLSAGARLVLAPSEALVPGPDMAAMMTQHQVSVVTLPPSALAVMNPQDYPSLHTVVSAGEACPTEVVSRWAKDRHFVNAYGPTEATVCATLTPLQPIRSTPPIGTPMDNVQTYILDPHLQPVPIGVPGELCIAGVGLARGYHLRPDLTAHKFIPHPFSIQPGDRLYRTGDLARFLPDGNIEFLGRIDHQVKLRGYRIELGEIESLLNQLPDVEQSLVIVREDTPADKRLVAYLIATQPELPIAALRHTLKQTLPDYMVPSAFITLDTFPLTPNGKIDRHALPAPELSREDQAASYVAPETLVEEALVDIWRHILGIEPISIHDNFFDLGGHSLLATRVVSQIQHTFEITIPLNDFFKAPTISDLALLIEEVLINEMEDFPDEQTEEEQAEQLVANSE